jgi:hypothetical protein
MDTAGRGQRESDTPRLDAGNCAIPIDIERCLAPQRDTSVKERAGQTLYTARRGCQARHHVTVY